MTTIDNTEQRTLQNNMLLGDLEEALCLNTHVLATLYKRSIYCRYKGREEGDIAHPLLAMNFINI